MNKTSIIHEIKKINGDIFKGISNRYKRMNVDVTPMHAKILMMISKSEDKLCQKDLEEIISCTKSTISSILSTMEKNDLLKREASETDSRVNYLVLTDKGLEMVEFLKKDRKFTEEVLTEGISDDEIEQFIQLTQKIRKNIERI